jgi:hypothetical protein
LKSAPSLCEWLRGISLFKGMTTAKLEQFLEIKDHLSSAKFEQKSGPSAIANLSTEYRYYYLY